MLGNEEMKSGSPFCGDAHSKKDMWNYKDRIRNEHISGKLCSSKMGEIRGMLGCTQETRNKLWKMY